ncbi:hypothetical protein KCU67_g8029, partial [Aureobasidium melanogenum]
MGHKTLLPAKSLYPRSMMRPEEVSDIVTFSSEQKVTFTQILTNQWEELEHSLYGSETSNITIKKIEATSQSIRKSANLPEPEVKAMSQLTQSVLITKTSYPEYGNHEISNRKRARRAELDVKSATPQSSTKRAKTTIADTPVKNFRKIERLCTYDHVLVVWSQPMTQKQQDFLRYQMKDMMKQKSVTDLNTFWNEASDSNRIKKPMQLSTIKTILEAGRYSSVTDLCTDFKMMITNVHLVCGETGLTSTAARRLFRSFCERMKDCPTGLDGRSAVDLGKKAIKRLESQMTDVTTKVTTPTSEEIEVIDIASDTDELEETTVQIDTASFINNFTYRDDTPDYESEDDVSDAEVDVQSSMQDGSASVTRRTAKTPEPDDLDDETRQLQKEIEERQQKLANMAEKKKLLAEIKNLDTEKAELVGKIPELEKQFEEVSSKVQDCRNMIDANHNDQNKTFDAITWNEGQRLSFQKESERLLQESERCRQKSEAHRLMEERLCSVMTEHKQRLSVLRLEKTQAEEQSRQVLQNEGQLKERRDQLESQRAIAKKKLDALSNGNA